LHQKDIILFSLHSPTLDFARKILVYLMPYIVRILEKSRKSRSENIDSLNKNIWSKIRYIPLCKTVMFIVITGSHTVMQNKYLANEKSIHAKTMLRTHPLLATREQHADLTCPEINFRVFASCFVASNFCLTLFRGSYHIRLFRIQRYEIVCVSWYLNSNILHKTGTYAHREHISSF